MPIVSVFLPTKKSTTRNQKNEHLINCVLKLDCYVLTIKQIIKQCNKQFCYLDTKFNYTSFYC